MLRRLLSNQTAAEEAGGGGGGTAPTAAEEPREYVLLAKMQPLPSIEAYPATGFSPPAHGQAMGYWPHLWENSPSPFPCSLAPEADFYWPNYMPSAHFHPPLGQHCLAAPPLPVPESAESSDHILQQNEQTFVPQMAIEEKCSIFYMDEEANEAADSEGGRKASLEESPASPAEEVLLECCPFCDRSFPVPKGSLRRHMAQCRRLKGIPKEGPLSKRAKTPCPGLEKKPVPPGSPSPMPVAHSSSATVDPSDPYQCRWCKFGTLYKGNIKRHLVTCHKVPYEILQKLNFDVERLRKLADNRPELEELPVRQKKDGAGKKRAQEEDEEDKRMEGDESEDSE